MGGSGMILGRNTQQWLGLIAALSGLLQILVTVLKPDLDPATVTVLLGAGTTFLGVLIAFIANTSTTPIADPKLVQGTSVQVMDTSGKVIGTSDVQAPVTPPVAAPAKP